MHPLRMVRPDPANPAETTRGPPKRASCALQPACTEFTARGQCGLTRGRLPDDRHVLARRPLVVPRVPVVVVRVARVQPARVGVR